MRHKKSFLKTSLCPSHFIRIALGLSSKKEERVFSDVYLTGRPYFTLLISVSRKVVLNLYFQKNRVHLNLQLFMFMKSVKVISQSK